MPSVYILGSINQDLVAHAPTLPHPGETVTGARFAVHPGGKGANQAVAAARAGATTYLAGATGNDAAGAFMRDFLQHEQVHLDYLQQVDVPTGVALITVADGENMITVCPGANHAFDIPQIAFAAGDIVAAQLEIPTAAIVDSFTRAKAAGVTTLLNTAPALPFDATLKNLCDILVLNETELATYAGTGSNTAAQAQQLRAHPDQIIIVTLGRNGLVCITGDDVITLPAHNVKAVDTTGAGDCFCGAFAAALCAKQPLRDALIYAQAASALSVQTEGAAPSMPTRDTILAFLKTDA